MLVRAAPRRHCHRPGRGMVFEQVGRVWRMFQQLRKLEKSAPEKIRANVAKQMHAMQKAERQQKELMDAHGKIISNIVDRLEGLKVDAEIAICSRPQAPSAIAPPW